MYIHEEQMLMFFIYTEVVAVNNTNFIADELTMRGLFEDVELHQYLVVYHSKGETVCVCV